MVLAVDDMLPELRNLGPAPIAALGAAGVEGATRRRVHGAGHIALQGAPLPAPRQVGHGYGGEQCLGIGVQRVRKELVGFGQFDDAPQVHDGDAVADVLDHGQVVRDEYIGKVPLVPELQQQLQDLRLDRNVQGRNRLVADDQFRIHRQRARDPDALALSAGKFVGVPVQVLALQVHRNQKVADDAFTLGARGDAVPLQRFLQRPENGEGRIQAGIGVLEDDLQGLAGLVQFLARQAAKIARAFSERVLHRAGGRPDQLQKGFAQGGLAAARLADQAEDLASIYIQIDPVHRLHLAGLGLEDTLPDGKICFDAPHPEQDFLAISHAARPPGA